MLIMDGQDSSFVDRAGFRGLMRHLVPKYEMPMAKEFSETIIPSILSRITDVSTLSQQFRQNKCALFKSRHNIIV